MDMSVISEFLGTYAIVYGTAAYGWLPIVLLIIILAKTITLGHLNPAVTLWYYFAGKIDTTTAMMYIFAQYAAAFAVFKLYT